MACSAFSTGISRTDIGMVEPSMTRTDQTDTDRTDLLPTRTYVVPDIDTTEDIEPTDTKDTFTPPTKVISDHFFENVLLGEERMRNVYITFIRKVSTK